MSKKRAVTARGRKPLASTLSSSGLTAGLGVDDLSLSDEPSWQISSKGSEVLVSFEAAHEDGGPIVDVTTPAVARPLKIALLGSAPSSLHLAPIDDPAWQIWGCSPGAYPAIGTHVRNLGAWFEMHRWEPPVIGVAQKQVPWFSPEYVAWMASLPCPVWMYQSVPEIPSSQAYPVEEMLKQFGPYFFTSSLAWMFAMALILKPEEIALFGVDMSATEEWGNQRNGCHYFIQLAEASGIKITVPPESDLLRPPPLYAICESDPKHVKWLARKKELEGRMAGAMQARDQAMSSILFLQGALDDLNYMLSTWV